jgi:hypothetical protein
MTYQLPALDRPDNTDFCEISPDQLQVLRDNVRVGFSKPVTEGGRGRAWWDSGLPDGTHFDGPVPQSEVDDILGVSITSVPVYALVNGEYQLIDNRQAIMVKGNVVNIPTEGYVPHPFHETLSGFLDQIRRDADVAVSSVGRLRNNALAFIQAVLPETHEIAGFGYQPYITGVTSADGKTATDYFSGGKAAICRNTLDMASAGALTRDKTKHTRNSLERLATARERLGIKLQMVGESVDEFLTDLVKTEVTDADFAAWLDEMAPLPEAKETKGGGPGKSYTMTENKRDELSRLYYKDPMVAPWNGTALGIFQAGNTYRTYTQTVKQSPGGRIERVLTNDMTRATGKADADSLSKLRTVRERRLTFV